jgi:hypothetical protein
MLACEDELTIHLPLTDTGTATAESTYADLVGDYSPALAIDNDQTTSWISDGPGPAGVPTEFSWTTQHQECITQVVIYGNGHQADPQLQRDHGFEEVTVTVVDSGKTVFRESRKLPGTPDPTVLIATGGVRGDQVKLQFADPERLPGGFSELAVSGVRPR